MKSSSQLLSGSVGHAGVALCGFTWGWMVCCLVALCWASPVVRGAESPRCCDAACDPGKSPAIKPSQIGRLLDDAAKFVEAFGSMHMSAPVLVSPTNGDGFVFELRRGASNYFGEAKSNVSGRVSVSEQVSQSLGLAARLQVDNAAGRVAEARQAEYLDAVRRRKAKQALLDQANQAQLDADLAAAGSNLVLVAKARQEHAERYAALAGTPGEPAALGGATGSNSLSAPVAQVGGLFSSNAFSPPGALLSSGSEPVLNNRAAIIQAAGDVAVESIFRTIGSSHFGSGLVSERMFIGFTTVSVEPGWRTRKGYAAEVTMSVRIEYRPARKEISDPFVEGLTNDNRFRQGNLGGFLQLLRDGSGRNGQLNELSLASLPAEIRLDGPPTEVSIPVQGLVISPLIDAEALDFEASVRRQNELALNLSFALRYAGMPVEAEAFEQYVKRREADVRTRSQFVAVNAFSSDGRFGFQVAPRVRTLGVDGIKRLSNEELGRQSFPALLLLSASLRLLTPRIGIHNRHPAVYEPVLVVTQTRRWLPLHFVGTSRFDIRRPSNLILGDARNGEKKRFELVDDLVEARRSLNQLCAETDAPWSRLALERLSLLEAQVAGAESEVRFDPGFLSPPPPSNDKPQFGNLDTAIPSSVLLEPNGADVKPKDVEIALLGAKFPASVTPSSLEVTAVPNLFEDGPRVEFKGGLVLRGRLKKTGSFVLMIQAKVGSDQVYLVSPPIRVERAGSVEPEKTHVVSLNVAVKDGSTTYSVAVPASSNEQANSLVRSLIAAELEKSRGSGLAVSLTNIVVNAVGTAK